MISLDDHSNAALPLPFPCKFQYKVIIISVMIHAGVILLLFNVPAPEKIPQLQIIQMNLVMQEGSFSVSPEHKKKSDNIQNQDKPARKTLTRSTSVPSPSEESINEQQATVKHFLPAETSVTGSRDSNISGSINSKGKGVDKAEGTIAPQTVSRGISETRFGEAGAPAFIHREMPVYPVMARRLGKEGKVVLKLLIDKYGRLQDVEVIEHAGFGFAEAAIKAVKNSTYAPASRNGVNVMAKALLPVSFRLQ